MTIENPELFYLLLAMVFMPLTLLALVGMFKHYHLWIHVYRGNKQHHRENEEDKS